MYAQLSEVESGGTSTSGGKRGKAGKKAAVLREARTAATLRLLTSIALFHRCVIAGDKFLQALTTYRPNLAIHESPKTRVEERCEHYTAMHGHQIQTKRPKSLFGNRRAVLVLLELWIQILMGGRVYSIRVKITDTGADGSTHCTSQSFDPVVGNVVRPPPGQEAGQKALFRRVAWIFRVDRCTLSTFARFARFASEAHLLLPRPFEEGGQLF